MIKNILKKPMFYPPPMPSVAQPMQYIYNGRPYYQWNYSSMPFYGYPQVPQPSDPRSHNVQAPSPNEGQSGTPQICSDPAQEVS